jgi:hypothetical protein
MPAPQKIIELVRAFKKDERSYISNGYSEAQARIDYIDPFLEELGWHPRSEAAYIAEWRDCIVERSMAVKDEIHKKRADYTCRIGKTPVLIIEAKAPSEDVITRPKHALQIRSYIYSQGLAIGALTNFAELSIYDGRIKPKKDDSAKVAQLETIRFTEYVEKWDIIESLLSKEAVLRGAQREYIARRIAKGVLPVDQAILADIDGWREDLAHVIARKNPELNSDALGLAIGRIIDRILFLRVCESRGMETEGQLKEISKGQNIYKGLLKLFQLADDRYNSGLFHFKEETGRSEKIDNLALCLQVEDKPLRQIINGLYYPENLYEYSLIPVEILGQVYEQFLGKVITIPRRGTAKIEEKPEVKKAGGVYYTPSDIVNYIVEHTVGKLIEGKTPKEIEKLRVLDPACGSGSFLLGAYQHLLDWHLLYYMKDGPAKHQKDICPDIQEGYRLTLRERKRILLTHIFGVDIDAQAVEVTKLSLLLKVLEGETHDTVECELKLRLRALPDLGKNIKCGNSLIGTDFYKGHFHLSDEEHKRINPFDWKKDEDFKKIMNSGGFNAVIGNPPWGATFAQEEIEYFRNKYVSTRSGTVDSYALFMESSLQKLSGAGALSFITPDTLLRKDNYESLRSLILEQFTVEELIETGPVFSQVRDTWCLISRLRNIPSHSNHNIKHKQISRFVVSAEERLQRFARREWVRDTAIEQNHWVFRPKYILGYLSDLDSQKVIMVMEKEPRLGSLSEKYLISRGEEGSKFNVTPNNRGGFYLVLPEHVSRYDLKDGIKVIKSGLTLGKLRAFYTKPKIWVIRIQKMRWKQRIVSAVDLRVNSAAMKTCQMICSVNDDIDALMYLQGILSSKLTNFWCENYLVDDMNQTYLEQIPIRTIDASNKHDRTCYDKLVKLVEQMLKLKQDLRADLVEHKQEKIERQIQATDEEIDELVYELYGLTAEEIKVVEGKS